jgi:hypothetical protein
LRVEGTIPDDFLTVTATNHISADTPNLLNEITEYTDRLRAHNKNIESLPRTIDSIVKNKFIAVGVYPTATDNYEKEGYYHFGDVGFVLNVDTWEGFLCGDRDIQSFARNFNFLGLQFDENGNILMLGGLVIGKGNPEQRNSIRRVLSEIARDRLILNALNDLMNSKSELDNRATQIRNMAAPLSTLITNMEYRRFCPCCPTQDQTIWNFDGA